MSEVNEEYLSELGVNDKVHQRIIIDKLPCGIRSVERAWEDETSCEINAPRAILVCYWKGMIDGFWAVEEGRRR